MIAPELMKHVAISFRWKELLYHIGSSFNVASILQTRLIAGGKDKKEGRQTVSFTPLDPFGDEAEEEFNKDSSRPIKVHFYSKWKPQQDAVYWIHLARAQEKGLQCWQTRSRAIILCDSVPADCMRKSGIPSRRQNIISESFRLRRRIPQNTVLQANRCQCSSERIRRARSKAKTAKARTSRAKARARMQRTNRP